MCYKIDYNPLDFLKIDVCEKIYFNRKITMYNCGFGDCFVISDDISNFLVDCGGLEKKVKADLPKKLSIDLKQKPCQLLITHFHKDHYNLIEHLDEDCKFDKIYLRNIYCYDNIAELTLVNLILSASSNVKWEEALYSIFCLDNLYTRLKKDGLFVFVKEYSEIAIGKTKYNVLSPSNNILIDFKLEDFSYSNYNQELNNILHLLEEYYDSIKQLIVDNNLTYNKIVDNINLLSHWKTLFDILNENRKILLTLCGTLKKNMKKKVLKSNLEHMFNVSFVDENRKILMLGDEETKKTDEIIEKYKLDNIYILKAPHHGTSSHIFKMKLRCKNVLISHSLFGRYGACYCCYYKTIAKHILCTNCNYKYDHRQLYNDCKKTTDYKIEIYF